MIRRTVRGDRDPQPSARESARDICAFCERRARVTQLVLFSVGVPRTERRHRKRAPPARRSDASSLCMLDLFRP